MILSHRSSRAVGWPGLIPGHRVFEKLTPNCPSTANRLSSANISHKLTESPMAAPLPGSLLRPPPGYNDFVAEHGDRLNPLPCNVGTIGHVLRETVESAFWLRTELSVSFYYRLAPIALRLKKIIAGEPCESFYPRDIRFT
jgi:hypothetical protein